MALSRRSVETLYDLVEIKLSCLQVFDREDARELATLKQCRKELAALQQDSALAAMPPEPKRRGPKPRVRSPLPMPVSVM